MRTKYLAVGLALLVILTACGGGSDDGEAPVASSKELAGLLPADLPTGSTIKIGSSLGTPPMNFTTDENEPTGLYVDVLTAAGELLGLKVEYQVTPFSGLAPALDAQRVDAIMAFTATEANLVKFVIATVNQSRSTLQVELDNPLGIEELTDICGLNNGYVTGDLMAERSIEGLQDACGEADLPEAKIAPCPSNDACNTAIRAGRSDGFLGSTILSLYREKTIGDLSAAQATDFVDDSEALFQGLAFRKDEAELAKAFAAAIAELQSSGTYKRIFSKYDTDRDLLEVPSEALGPPK